MAPNSKPRSYVMQQQQALLPPVMNTKESNIQVKKECILFSQSVMNGWTPASGAPQAQMSQANNDGPEPRILSKKRRDLINAEIRELQNLLPLKKSSRERLSYLGILALTNTFIRKATFFKKECIGSGSNPSAGLVSDFANSLSGFLLVFNREGKILFSSDNILDYLGHTVVELASQGDSIYDIIDKEDHEMIRSQLEMQPQSENGEPRRLSFFCRMSTSRYMKTQMRSWKNKIVHVVGKYHKPEMSNDWSDTAFFAVCEPIESKPVTDVRHHPTPRPTEFKAVHSPDMKFLEVPNHAATLLGYEPDELVNTSWYQWIFPEDLNQARQQHMKFVKEDGSAFACVIRMIHKNGELVWVDVTAEKSQEAISNSFVCNYIVIEEDEVPYYRLHHNLLPFPDHYSDVKRHYLAANSSLLATALNSDVGMASPSSMGSPTGRHPQSPGAGMSHMLMASQFADNMDTKSLLRRQLKRKLGVSMDSSLTPTALSPGSYATGMEIFNLPPPNKMMMRRHTAGDLLYQAAGQGMYHGGIHPSAYHETIHHPMYMPPPPLLNDTSALIHPEHHYRGEYTTIAQRPIDLPMHTEAYSSSSPRTLESPMLRQSNQNNNVAMYQPNIQEFKQSPPPLRTNERFPTQGSPSHSPVYINNEPPRLNHAHSPPLPVNPSPMSSPQKCDVMNHSPEDSFYCDVNNIIDCSGAPMTSANTYALTSPASSHGNFSPAHSGYASSTNECMTSSANGPIDTDLRNLITSYENQLDDTQFTSPQHYSNNASSQLYQHQSICSPPQSKYSRKSFQIDSRSPLQEINTSCTLESKPYQLQYSITPHPPRSVFSGRNQRRFANGERSVDWMKKYSHMTPMEMLLSDSESNSSYYG
ncbi:uncharacterized protein LOC120331835 isoform X1 [Styela clava]